MRAIPITKEMVWRLGGGERRILAEPGGDLTSTEISPLEVVVQPYVSETLEGRQYVSVWTFSEEERAAVAAGADIMLIAIGLQPPVALGVLAVLAVEPT